MTKTVPTVWAQNVMTSLRMKIQTIPRGEMNRHDDEMSVPSARERRFSTT